jgi:DNA-binding transcriptional LysR family regulator
MGIDEIWTFVAIAGLGSFTRAGVRQHCPQP